jgi:hypothetical protein
MTYEDAVLMYAKMLGLAVWTRGEGKDFVCDVKRGSTLVASASCWSHLLAKLPTRSVA